MRNFTFTTKTVIMATRDSSTPETGTFDRIVLELDACFGGSNPRQMAAVAMLLQGKRRSRSAQKHRIELAPKDPGFDPTMVLTPSEVQSVREARMFLLRVKRYEEFGPAVFVYTNCNSGLGFSIVNYHLMDEVVR